MLLINIMPTVLRREVSIIQAQTHCAFDHRYYEEDITEYPMVLT